MTMNRFAKLAALAALGTLSLAACGGQTVSAPEASSGGNASSATSTSGETGSGGLACPEGKLTGEGSSAQTTAIQESIDKYNGACGGKATIEYNPTGSGAGIKSFYQGLVDWAGSDSVLKTEEKDGVIEADKAKERCSADAWNLPMVVGPIAFAYNLDGVDTLVLTPEVISNIFNGKIKKWDDAAIKKLNPDATLPSENITVFYRADESGTTENMTKYLAAAGKGAWTAEPAKTWAGKVGEGKNKTSGVAEAVKASKNSLSYMEWGAARDNDLGIAQLDNGGGAVELTGDAVAKAVEAAETKGSGNDLSLSLNYKVAEADAYPALLVTYEIVCSKGLDADKTAVLKDFLTYFASEENQAGLEDLGYAPLPASLREKVTTAVSEIQ